MIRRHPLRGITQHRSNRNGPRTVTRAWAISMNRVRDLVVVIVVVIHIVVIAATPLRFLKFFAALACLSAVLAVALHRVTQLILSLVNTLFVF